MVVKPTRMVRMLSPADRRAAVLLEALPLGGAAALGLGILLILSTTPDGGWDQYLDQMPQALAAVAELIFLPLAMLMGLAALAFLVSGVGWIRSDRASVGVPLMILRFFISIFAAVPLGPTDGGLLGYLPGFAFSLGLAAASIAALAYSTGRGGRVAEN